MKKFLAVSLVIFLLPLPAMARDPWDADMALGVVDGLIRSLARIVEMSGNAEGLQPDAVMSKKAQAALVDIEFVLDELRQLQLALSAGRNRPQTYAQYRKVSNLSYSIQDYASATELSDEVRREAGVARRLMRELDLFYF